MVVRLLLALGIVLLVAAAVDSRVPVEQVDADVAALIETDAVVVVPVPPVRPITNEVVSMPHHAAIPPPDPELSRVFRPPRPDSSS
jgi:hypothetical protein